MPGAPYLPGFGRWVKMREEHPLCIRARVHSCQQTLQNRAGFSPCGKLPGCPISARFWQMGEEARSASALYQGTSSRVPTRRFKIERASAPAQSSAPGAPEHAGVLDRPETTRTTNLRKILPQSRFRAYTPTGRQAWMEIAACNLQDDSSLRDVLQPRPLEEMHHAPGQQQQLDPRRQL